jgi:DNA-binding NarL/FixJ family response regulator
LNINTHSTGASADNHSPGIGRKVILAEDESIIAFDLSRGLKRLGYNIIKVVSKGKDLIEEAMKSDPDIIVSDIHLKDNITGVEAVEIIHHTKHTGFILISGFNDAGTIKLIEQANPCSFIRKPCSAADISSAIKKCLNDD